MPSGHPTAVTTLRCRADSGQQSTRAANRHRRFAVETMRDVEILPELVRGEAPCTGTNCKLLIENSHEAAELNVGRRSSEAGSMRGPITITLRIWGEPSQVLE